MPFRPRFILPIVCWLWRACCGVLALSLSTLGPSLQGGTNYVARSWTSEEGLPQNSVNAMLQTRDGYIWIATFNGLVRFDGLRFTTFNSANTEGLASDWVSALVEDRDGTLWIGTHSGVSRIRNGTLTRFPGSARLNSSYVHRMVETPDGLLLVAAYEGMFWIRGEQSGEIIIPNAQWPAMASWVAVDSKGTAFLAQKEYLYSLKKNPGSREGLGGELQLHTVFPRFINQMFVTRDGTMWFGPEDHSLVCWYPDGTTNRYEFKGPELRGTEFADILQARDGTVWMATRYAGLAQWGPQGLRNVSVGPGPLVDRLSSLLEDREGGIWVGTDGAGLQRLRENVVTTITSADGLGYDDIASVMQDRKGRIWVGAFSGGLNLFENGAWKRVHEPGVLRLETTASAILEARDGTLWICCYGEPLCRMKDGQLKAEDQIQVGRARVLFEDRDGGIWVGSEDRGAERFHNGNVTSLNTTNGLTSNSVRAILQDHSGAMWIGAEHGLNQVRDGSVIQYFQRDGLAGNLIQTLYLDKEGTLWIGGAGGLTRYRNGKFGAVGSRHGLFSEMIAQIIEDDAGNLWCGSNAGIFRIRKQSIHDVLDGRAESFISMAYGRASGMRHPECAGGFQPSTMKTSDGRLWFSTVGGLAIIDPGKITPNTLPPTVHVEAVMVDGVSQRSPEAPLALPKEIIVPPGAQRVEFRYTGLNFSASDQIQFKYQLDDYDEGWQVGGAERIAGYKRVPPGRYRFRVIAGNNQGVWTDSPVELAVWVQPLFRQTVWYRALWITAIGGTLFLFYRLRMDGVRRMEQLRLRIANDLHDEAGSNLGTIQLLSRRAANRLDKSKSSVPELAEIQQITATTAASLRDAVWLIDPEFDTLDQMINGIETLAARLFADISYDLQCNISSRNRKLSAEFRTHFFLTFKEILHNIQKHARATRVEIWIEEGKGFIQLRVRDNGVGFEPERVARGHGLASMRDRARQLGAALQIESRPGSGTEILLKVRHTRLRDSGLPFPASD